VSLRNRSSSAQAGRSVPEPRVLFVNTRHPGAGIGGAESAVGVIAAAVRQVGGVAALATIAEANVSGAWQEDGDDLEWPLTGSKLSQAQQGEDLTTVARVAAHLSDLNPSCGAAELRSVVEGFQPSVIVTNNIRGLGAGTLQACSEACATWVHIPHDVQLLVPSGLWPLTPSISTIWDKRLIRAPYTWWMRRLVDDVEAVMAPTDFIARVHREAGFFERADVIVERLPRSENSLDPHQLSETRGHCTDEPITIAMIGRLSPHKGFVWALDALAGFSHPLHVVVCGSGEDREAILERERVFKGNLSIAFRGHVSPAARAEVLASSDVLLVPSLVHENSPLVIEEAAAAGVPVVASRSGGVPEFVKSEWIFDAGDAGDLRNVITNFIEERPLLTQLPVQRPTPEEYARMLLSTASAVRSRR
jgi:glycosyltransferase involved in cell wall biosynthesis